MSVLRVRYQIMKLAREFDLRYNSLWFKHSWISVRHEILTEYLGGCPDPIYQKYGKTVKERVGRLSRFVNSGDFETCLKRYGGQVVQKSEIRKEEKRIKQIKNEALKKDLLMFYANLGRQFGEANFLALLTIPRNKKEEDYQMRFCLRHEWIHILLDENEIQFQKIAKKYWPYDEGINEYMGSFLDNTLDQLEKFRDMEDYPMEKKYWIYAIKLREILKDKNSPAERKEAIFDLLRSLIKLNKS